uniref:Uncharacterized protein n=1 Tax=Anguilla anguilla TaxID=7936 RepID=A0A0E9XVI8_ANGAN
MRSRCMSLPSTLGNTWRVLKFPISWKSRSVSAWSIAFPQV